MMCRYDYMVGHAWRKTTDWHQQSYTRFLQMKSWLRYFIHYTNIYEFDCLRYIPDTLALVWRICTDTVMIHPQTLDWVKHDCVMITGIVQHIGPAIYVYTCYISSKWHFNGDTLSYVDRFIILVGHDDPTIRMLFGSLITRVAWVLNVASEIKTLSNIDITVVHWQLVITR